MNCQTLNYLPVVVLVFMDFIKTLIQMAANELKDNIALTYKHNFPNTNVIVGDITKKEIKNKVYECFKDKCSKFRFGWTTLCSLFYVLPAVFLLILVVNYLKIM